MNVFTAMLGRRPSRERPDLAAWIAGAPSALVVDGAGPGVDAVGSLFPGRTVLRHEISGGPGLPFHFPDTRRPPRPAGGGSGYAAVVLGEVLDKVIDAGAAVDEAMRVAAPGAELVVVQTVAPEDFEERAIWNAVARMRDPRHASAPSARQLTAMLPGLGMEIVRDAAWEETADPAATLRPDAARALATMLDAAVARGAANVVRDGALVLARRAFLLRRK